MDPHRIHTNRFLQPFSRSARMCPEKQICMFGIRKSIMAQKCISLPSHQKLVTFFNFFLALYLIWPYLLGICEVPPLDQSLFCFPPPLMSSFMNHWLAHRLLIYRRPHRCSATIRHNPPVSVTLIPSRPPPCPLSALFFLPTPALLALEVCTQISTTNMCGSNISEATLGLGAHT